MATKKPDNHDSHYKGMAVESITVQEAMMGEQSIEFLLATSVKYIMRAGKKSGEAFDKDLHKAMNYINRARTGEWL